MKFLFISISIFFFLPVFSQERNNADSIKCYIDKGQIHTALTFGIEYFETLKNRPADSIYISAAEEVGGLYYRIAKYDSALYYFTKACAGAKQEYGENSKQYLSLLINVACIYRDMELFREAAPQFQEAMRILKDKDLSYKNIYTNCLIAYAVYFLGTANLNKAEELCLKAYKVSLTVPVDMSAHAALLPVMIRLYEKLGFNEKRETAAIRFLETAKTTFGEKHSRYAEAMAAMGAVYQNNQKQEKADSFYRQALAILQRINGEKAATNIFILRRIAMVNIEMKKYDVAEHYLQEALNIVNENGGEQSPLYVMCSNNLARLYVYSGRKKLADSLFHKSLDIYNQQRIELQEGRLMLLYDMASLLYADDTEKAILYLNEAADVEYKMLLNKLDFLSETELITYVKGTQTASDKLYAFLMSHNSPAIAKAAYNYRLLVSNIGLQNTRSLYQKMSQSGDSIFIGVWKNYIQQKSLYTELVKIPATQRNNNTDSIADLINSLEKDVLRRSADYRNIKERLLVNWQEVQKQLQPSEAAIELIKFSKVTNTYPEQDTFYYAAMVLRPEDSTPQFIMLCKETQLLDALRKFPYKAAVNERGINPGTGWQNPSNDLFRLIWEPLEPFLNNSKRLYFSPDGLLHRVAFAAIPYTKNKLLCDKYDLIQLTSTRQLVIKETLPDAPVSVVMFGGIDYNRQSPGPDNSPVNPPYFDIQPELRAAGVDSFSFLPNTLAEIDMIKKEAEISKKSFIQFTAANATENAFRSFGNDQSPTIIHFATHGFTFPDISSKRKDSMNSYFKKSDIPLLNCGLIMAGGNKGWKGQTASFEDDGILTGLEISSVQLPNTQLAVLSACETALGKIEGSEGVLGLQRAFKLAGVNYVMASLWQVPDKETAEFMQIFYAHWFNGETIRKAFSNTQQIMHQKYPPYYWAGFTLIQ